MQGGRSTSRPLPVIRNRYFFAMDWVAIGLAAVGAFWLRLDFQGLSAYDDTLLVFGVTALVVKPLIFYLFGFYRRYWRYATARDVLTITLAAVSGSAVTTVAVTSIASYFLDFRALPRSIPVLDFLISVPLIGGPRFAARLLGREGVAFLARNGDDRLKSPSDDRRRVLVMGAGDAGALIVREMLENPGLGLEPVGLLDDNEAKVGMTIYGVEVQGTRDAIPHLVRTGHIEEVLIAMPTAPGKAIRQVAEICHDAGVGCRTMPGIYELISGQVSVRQIREITIDDLLRREPVHIDAELSPRYLRDAVVLVTGAGGSIGAELCRQIAARGPRRLVLLGHGEMSIFQVLREIRATYPHLDARPVIADIRHGHALEGLFRRHRPDVVFHAAAHKHVPLMEVNVSEAVANNVVGTRVLLEAAEAHGTGRFVLISTDKAVNPVNVMGATKRLAELLVQAAAERTGRPYVAVRFGNVLGSRGSAVPLFQQQIAAGGPVTVTHPEMERYFMTIPEAVQLVIQAGAMGEGGEVFVLDMGEQVRIVDLAHQLIELSGLEPGRDIDVVFTEPRPGEKLSEELFCQDEEPGPTRHEKILRACASNCWSLEDLEGHVATLERLADGGDPGPIQAKLQEIVPNYHPHVGLDVPSGSRVMPADESRA